MLLPSLIWLPPCSLSQRSLLVLRTDMQPWMWMSFYQAAEWDPVSHRQTLTATSSPWPNFIRMERRFCVPPFLSFASVPGYSSVSFCLGMKRRIQASLPPLPVWNSRMVLEARLFLREGLYYLISFPIRFCGLPIVQDCSHKNLHFYFLQFLALPVQRFLMVDVFRHWPWSLKCSFHTAKATGYKLYW